MIITTHNLKPVAPIAPKPLNIITTAIIPNAPKDAPAPVGDGFAKMITTHDEPGPKFKIVIKEPKPGEPNLADAMGKAFEADAKEYADKAGAFDAKKAIDNLVIDIHKDDPIDLAPPAPKVVTPAPKKKGGRPKKAAKV